MKKSLLSTTTKFAGLDPLPPGTMSATSAADSPEVGRQRSSNTSTVSRRRAGRRRIWCVNRFWNHMVRLLSGDGLQYNEQTKDRGAQTERRGLAGPVRN